MGFEASFCISLQKLDTPDSTVIDFFKQNNIDNLQCWNSVYVSQRWSYENTVASDNEMLFIFEWFPTKCINLSVLIPSPTVTRTPQMELIQPSSKTRWGVLRGVQGYWRGTEWNEGDSRGIKGVGGNYIVHVYIHDKISIRMDPSTWSLAGGGFGWLRLILRLVNCQSSPKIEKPFQC